MKLKRGQKRCKKCQAINAARQRVCISCNQTFQVKNTPIKNEIRDWRNLQQGDAFRGVNGTGPYYVLTRNCSEGEVGDRLFIGCKGKYVVEELKENGMHAWSVSSQGISSHEFVYMGEDGFCEKLNLHKRAHRLVKIKHKNKYKMY